MKSRVRYTFFILVALLFAGCGAKNGGETHDPASPPKHDDTNPPKTGEQYNLALFAMTSCIPCQHELPSLQEKLRSLGEKHSRVSGTVYMVAADNGQVITQPIADDFGKQYGLSDFKMVADKYGMTYYRKYYSGSPNTPAAVILKSDGTVVKKYQAGTVDVDALVSEVVSLLN